MRQTIRVTLLTLLALIAIDVLVAIGLRMADRANRLGSLTNYMDLGRSVPGKLADWQSRELSFANPLIWAWIDERLENATKAAADRPEDAGPVMHSYGVSFTRNVVREAVKLDPKYSYITLGGPSAPPNHTYTLITQDRPNRRAGDVIVFGMLSTSLPAMGSLSNRTWSFEQPAAYTYPIYHPHQNGLRAMQPLVSSMDQQLALDTDSAQMAAWHHQLQLNDALFTPLAFQARWLDHSPFARMLRRALARDAIEAKKAAFLESDYPRSEVLRRMLREVQAMAHEDGQTLVVLLSQAENDPHVDLRAELEPILAELGISFVATQDFADPNDPLNFVSDGHYAPRLDQIFAAEMLKQINEASP